MSPTNPLIATAKAIGIYVVASLLLGACNGGGREGKITIRDQVKGPGKGEEKITEPVEFTGAENDLGDKYAFLGSGRGPKAMAAVIRTILTTEEIAGAAAASEEYSFLEIIERRGTLRFRAGILPTEGNKLKSVEEISFELKEKTDELVKTFVGSGAGHTIKMTCETDSCVSAMVMVSRDEDKVRIPMAIELRQAKISQIQAHFDRANKSAGKEELLQDSKGQKKFVLQALLEKPNLDSALVSTVNLATMQSRFFLGLEGEVEKGRKQRLELHGELVQIQEDPRQLSHTLEPALTRPSESHLLAASKEQIRLRVNVGEKQGEATLKPSRVEFSLDARDSK